MWTRAVITRHIGASHPPIIVHRILPIHKSTNTSIVPFPSSYSQQFGTYTVPHRNVHIPSRSIASTHRPYGTLWTQSQKYLEHKTSLGKEDLSLSNVDRSLRHYSDYNDQGTFSEFIGQLSNDFKRWLFKYGNRSAAMKISLLIGGTGGVVVLLFYGWKYILGLGVIGFGLLRMVRVSRRRKYGHVFHQAMEILQKRKNVLENTFNARLDALKFPVLSEMLFSNMLYRGPPERRGVLMNFEIGTPIKRGSVWAWATREQGVDENGKPKYVIREIRVDTVDVRDGSPSGPINAIELYSNLEDMHSIVDSIKQKRGEQPAVNVKREEKTSQTKVEEEEPTYIEAEVVEDSGKKTKGKSR